MLDIVDRMAVNGGTRWLKGGTGADILSGAARTNVLLANPSTIVQGGTAATSFNITKVIGPQGAAIDLYEQPVRKSAATGLFGHLSRQPPDSRDWRIGNGGAFIRCHLLPLLTESCIDGRCGGGATVQKALRREIAPLRPFATGA
jgi:hypothetical protein